jgi:hypothetical protein
MHSALTLESKRNAARRHGFRVTAIGVAAMLSLALLLAAGVAGSAFAIPAAAREEGDLPLLLEEAANDLLLLAGKLLEASCLDAAAHALAASSAFVPDAPGADALGDRILARQTARPRPAPALNTALFAQSLFNGKSLARWKKNKGKWEAERGVIICDAGKSNGLLSTTPVPTGWSGLTFTVTIELEAEAHAGVVFGRTGRNRVGVIFDDSGAALYDFKTRRTLSDHGKRRFPHNRRVAVSIAVCGGHVAVSFQGKPAIEASLDAWEPGEIGLYARGFVRFREPKLLPIEIDACIDGARSALKKRNLGQAASLLLRGSLVLGEGTLDRNSPAMATVARATIAALLARAFDDLGFRDDAGRNARAFLEICDTRRSLPPDLRRLRSATARIAAGAAGDLTGPESRIMHWAGRVLAAGEKALARGDADDDLDTVTATLRALGAAGRGEGRGGPFVDGEKTEDFRTRVFLSRCGTKEGLPLFNGSDLSGWTQKGGGWAVLAEVEVPGAGVTKTTGATDAENAGVADTENAGATNTENAGVKDTDIAGKGIIAVVAGDASNILEGNQLPPFDRYLLKTSQRGTGNYLDQGVRFHVLGEPWSVRLFRFMGKQEITVLHGDRSVYFCQPHGSGLTSGEWHDVDFLVHMNRLTVIVDGDALFTKILPAPPDSRLILFTSPERRGHFRDLLFRPLGRKGEYRTLLEKLGVPAREVTECENLKAQTSPARGKIREQPFAYSGYSLTGVFDRKDRTGISYRFKTLSLADAVLSIRYSAVPAPRRADKGPADAPAAKLLVFVDGQDSGVPVDLVYTGSINDFTYARARLGDLFWGDHAVRIKTLSADGRVVVDRLVLTDSAGIPLEETKLHDSAEAPHFRIRLSPGVQLPENSEDIFALLEELREYMIGEYGFEPADPQHYNLISRECWGDPHKGGYATGDNIYIPEETTARGISVIMHELSHNFDRDMGFNPPWFGEGKSFPVFARFRRDHSLRYRKFQRPFALSDIDSGEDAFRELECNGENLLQYWGTAKFPYWGKTPDGRNLTSFGYRSSNWLMWELTEYLGETWLLDYFTLIRKEIDEHIWFMPKDRVQANSVLIDTFARSSGKDALRFFRAKRFKLVNIYGWREIAVDCGRGEEIYLTDTGGSTVTEGEKGGGKARSVTDGAFTYAFPVAPGTKSLAVTITRSGYGTCHAWGKRLYRGKASGDWEKRTFKLKDPTLWADSRLRLTFASEKYGDRTTRIASIVIVNPTAAR